MQLKNNLNAEEISVISFEVIRLHESARILECFSEYLEIAKRIRGCADDLSNLLKKTENFRKFDKSL